MKQPRLRIGRPECRAGSDVRNPTPRATCPSEHPRGVSPNYLCPLALCSGHASCVLLARMVGPESRNRRQHPRTRVSWPVVVETGTHRYPCELTDLSNRGAKVMTREQLETGSVYGCISSRRTEPRSASGRWCGELMPTGWRSLSPAAFTIASSTSPSSAGSRPRRGTLAPATLSLRPTGAQATRLRLGAPEHQKCGDMHGSWARDRVGLSTLGHMRLRRRVQTLGDARGGGRGPAAVGAAGV